MRRSSKIGIDGLYFRVCQLQLGVEADIVRIEQVGQDGELIQIAVVDDAVVLFGLANRQGQGLDTLHRLLVVDVRRPYVAAYRLPLQFFRIGLLPDALSGLMQVVPVLIE